jgi:hypothetical protein
MSAALAPREQFEALIVQLTGCVTGDGTLEVKADRKTYKNTYIEYMWMRFKTKGKK